MPRGRHLAVLLPALLVAGCGADFFGEPPRVATHGYRATVNVLKDDEVVSKFELAVRGDDLRRELPSGPFPVYVLRGGAGRAFELDPATKTVRDAEPAQAVAFLRDHPLAPGFSEKAMATQLGLERYARESDTPFGGNACHVWRFDDDPDADVSPATWYWVAPALDRLVVQRQREEILPDGKRLRTATQLLNVRPGAATKLFEEPEGWRRVERPVAPAR